MTSPKQDIEAIVYGFSVKTLTATQGKGEEDAGTLKLALIGNKDDIKVSESSGLLHVSDVVAALNTAQELQTTVDIKLVFSVPADVAKTINEARSGRRNQL